MYVPHQHNLLDFFFFCLFAFSFAVSESVEDKHLPAAHPHCFVMDLIVSFEVEFGKLNKIK